MKSYETVTDLQLDEDLIERSRVTTQATPWEDAGDVLRSVQQEPTEEEAAEWSKLTFSAALCTWRFE